MLFRPAHRDLQLLHVRKLPETRWAPHGIGGRECSCAVSPSLPPPIDAAASPFPFPSRDHTSSVPLPRRSHGLVGRLCRGTAQRYRRGARHRGPRPRRGRPGTPRGGLQVSSPSPVLSDGKLAHAICWPRALISAGMRWSRRCSSSGCGTCSRRRASSPTGG